MPDTILVVDDDPAIRMLVQRALTRAGYAVTTAPDGAEAIAALTVAGPSLVITDLQMPRLDGHAVIAHVRHDHPKVPILVMTGTPEGAELGGIPVLPKPFQITTLLGRVKQLLAGEFIVHLSEGNATFTA